MVNYKLWNFFENVQYYGIREALRKDLETTKKDLSNLLSRDSPFLIGRGSFFKRKDFLERRRKYLGY